MYFGYFAFNSRSWTEVGMGEHQKVRVSSEHEHVVFHKVRVSSEHEHLSIEYERVSSTKVRVPSEYRAPTYIIFKVKFK